MRSLGKQGSRAPWRTFAASCLVVLGLAAGAARAQVTYSVDADFDLGVLNSVNHEVPGQLGLNSFSETEPFIYIADPNQGILLKMDTRTGKQVGRYDTVRVADCSLCATTANRSAWSPSRTAVDLDGNVWVANRAFNGYGTVTKIASSPGACVDRNADGVIQTSRDANGDGYIDRANAAEFFGQGDECIVKSIPVGGYNAVLRALAIDGDGKLWVGLWTTREARQIDPATGATLKVIALGLNPYGFVARGQYLYSASYGSIYVARVDLAANPPVVKTLTAYGNYGITVDDAGIAWFGSYATEGGIFRCDFGGTATACTNYRAPSPDNRQHTGIVADPDGNIWAAAYSAGKIDKFSSAGAYLGSVAPTGCNAAVNCYPYGMAVAHDGAIWAAGRNGGAIRVERGPVDGAPGAWTVYTTAYTSARQANENYSYSDMTGYLLRNITVQQGSWTVVQDAGFPGAAWGTVSWNAEAQGATPAGTSIAAQVRAADELAGLETRAWVPVSNGVLFSGAGVAGRYLEVRLTLLGTETASPVLSDVTIAPAGSPPGTACTSAAECALGFCVDGVCCESACAGQCEACGAAGLCLPVLGAPAGGRPACASDGSVCGGSCDGILRDACLYPGAEVACREASCAEGTATAAEVCGGAGSCALHTTQCSPYVCGASACLEACAGDGDCAVAFLCESGACTADVGPPTVVLGGIAPYLPSAPRLTGNVSDRGGIASAAFIVNGSEFPVVPAADGSVSLDTVGLLSEGENTVVLRATDRAGNPASAAATFVLDTIPPAVAISSPLPGAAFGTSDVPVQVHVTDASPSTVQVGEATTPVPGTGDVSGTVSLPAEGANTIVVSAWDAAGNTGHASVEVLLDFTAPIVGSDDLVSGARYGSLPGDLLLFHLRVDDLTATTASILGGGTYRYDRGGGVAFVAFRLLEGPNDISVTVVDEVGGTTTRVWTVVYDLTPPVGAVTSPLAGAFLRGTIDLAADAADALTGVAAVVFEVAGQAIPGMPAENDAWTGAFDTTTVSDGGWAVRATFTDGVGNASSDEVPFTVDNTAPTVSITSPADGAWARGAISLGATADDLTSGIAKVELFVNGTSAGSCAGATCTVVYDTSPLSNGPFVVRAVATDRAGNTAEAQVTAVADNTAPSKFLISPVDGAIVAGTLTVAVDVRGDAVASVACTLDGVLLFATVEPSWSQTVPLLDRLDGPLAVRCEATDQAGNVGVETANVTIRNWSVVVNPSSLKLGTGGGTVTVYVEGPNVALLLPIQGHALALVVPGGSPVPALMHPASAALADEDRDGVPDLTLKFDRPPVVGAIRAGIATGAIDPAVPLAVWLHDGNRPLGSDTIKVIR